MTSLPTQILLTLLHHILHVGRALFYQDGGINLSNDIKLPLFYNTVLHDIRFYVIFSHF